MRCLVTGGAGFLGSHLLAHLIRNGDVVTALLRPSTDPWRIRRLLPHIEVLSCDLAEEERIEQCLQIARPEIVYHLAWAGGNSGKYQNDLTQIEANLPASVSLLRKSAEAGVRRWIGCGSAAEYGLVSGPISESATPQPHTLYGISKYTTCLTTAKMCGLLGLQHLWIRPFAIYGPCDNSNGLIPFIIRTLLRGESPALTAGEQQWDYLQVDDAVEALVQLASAPKASGIYNIASGEALSIRSLVEHIRDMINPNLPLGFGEIPYPADQIMSLQANISKIRQTTNWCPQISLDEGLRRMIDKTCDR